MSFGEPILLFGLVLVPLAALAYLAMQGRKRREAAAFANPALMPNLVTARPGMSGVGPPELETITFGRHISRLWASEKSRVELASLEPLAMPLEVQFLKTAWLNREAHGRTWEPTLASYAIPFEEFLRRNARLDLSRVAAIRFLMASDQGSVIVLDDVGVARSVSPAVDDGERNDHAERDER